MKQLLLVLMTLAFISANAQDFPETFDLRDYDGVNYVTSVKSQEGGTCWTHGAVAAIEGNLLMNGNWVAAGLDGEPNLSEYHLDWWNGFNSEFNQDTMPNDGSGLDVHYGGDYRVTSAYLSRGDGVVKDTVSETYWFNNTPSRENENYKMFYVRHMEWYIVEEDISNIDLIKQKIMDYGVMGTCMAYNGSFINGQYEHYQPYSSDVLPNHAVAIIGWDDNRETQADQPGAWLVKNSWGEWWGNSGYFWISYYDKWATREPEMGAISFIDVVEPFFDTIYYHDYHGWRDTREDVSLAMNAFEAHDSVTLKAVNFYTAADTVSFTCTIYDDFESKDLTNQLGQVTGIIDHTGLHTIDLEEELGFAPGDDFYISLEFDKDGMPFDRTSEVPVLLCGNNKKTVVHSTSSPNQSFYKNTSDEWVDFYYEGDDFWQYSGNFCMKPILDYGMDPTGITGNAQIQPKVKVMPQPAKNTATIQLNTGNIAQGELMIITIDGKLVQQVNVTGKSSMKIDLSNLPEGFYIYRMNTKHGFVSGKLIKE